MNLWKAAKDVSDFYAAWDLAEVTTAVNLTSLVCCITGFGIKSQVRKVMPFIDASSKALETPTSTGSNMLRL